MSVSKQITVKFPVDEIGRIDRIAAERGITRADTIRLAVSAGYPLIQASSKIDLVRVVTAIEFCQTALDGILSRDHPDFAAAIWDVVIKRMDDHHA